jgi:preprotein translocase subunit SecD
LAGFRAAACLLFTVLFAAAPAAAAALGLTVVRAYVVTDEATGRPALSLTLAPESKQAFGDFTGTHVGHQVELRIDGKVVMVPTIRDPIRAGEVMVSGDFTRLELLEIANGIWSGKARVEVEPKAD